MAKNPPSGFRDFLPESAQRRLGAMQKIAAVYRSFGFQPIATPAVEDLKVLLGKGGAENEKLIFKILKRGEKLDAASSVGALADLGLRFDLTVPLARFYGCYGGQLPKPFKVFQMGPVWRAERAQKGRFREFLQCDVDILGSESVLAEIEIISAMAAAFEALGLSGAAVCLNDRSLVYAALARSGVPPEKQAAVCIILDKLDKIPRETVSVELETLVGKSSAQAIEKILMRDSSESGAYEEAGPEAYSKLSRIAASVSSLTQAVTIKIVPSLMRGFDYYTGPVFEFRASGFSGSIGGGGRYDHLIEKLGGPKTSACGGSIGFERLMLLLEERKEATSEEAGGVSGPGRCRVCVAVFSPDFMDSALKIAGYLRQEGFQADIYPGDGKLKAQFKYADSKKADFAVIEGPDEKARGVVKAKNLKTGEEFAASIQELVVKLKAAHLD